MARSTTTANQANALANPRRVKIETIVYVDDGSGNQQDLTELRGYNWVHSVQYEMSSGEPLMKATVRLFRETQKMSLAPFMDGSILNASGTVVDIGREIWIYTAVVPNTCLVTPSDRELVFHGYIKAVSWESNPIVLECLDLGYKWMKRFIETQYIYAAVDDALPEVVQDVVDDNDPDLDTLAAAFTWDGTTTVTTADTSEVVVGDFIGVSVSGEVKPSPFFEITAITPNTDVTIDNTGGRTIPTTTGGETSYIIPAASRTTLFVEGAAPTWAVKTYYQQKNRVLPALRIIAQQIGYELNYRWNATEGDFVLTLWEPDRDKAAPDVTIGPDVYGPITKLSVDDANIRNRIKIVADTTASGRTSVVREDLTSQAKYGTQYMEVTEGATSQIDTVTEMQTMGDAILSDLKEPEADLAVDKIPYRWDLQLGDLVRFESNGIHFDTDQDLAPVRIRHDLPQNGMCRTTITARGTPSGGVRRWLELEGLPGVAPPVDLKEDSAAENVSATVGVGTLVVTYDDPRTMDPPVADWAYTDCYVHTADPGSPPSASYLVATGKQTRFEIAGLVPGTTYYCRLVIIDQAGNAAATSSVVSDAVQKVGPYHTNQDSETGPINPNSNFGIVTLGNSVPPDYWSVIEGSYGNSASNWYYSTSIQLSGGRSLRWISDDYPAFGAGNSAYRFGSDLVVVEEGRPYVVEFSWRRGASGDNYVAFGPTVYWYDSSGGYLSASIPSDTTFSYGYSGNRTALASTSWIYDRGWVVPPADARFAKVLFVVELDDLFDGDTHPDLYFDRYSITRARAQLELADLGSDRSATSGTWTTPWFSNSPGIDSANGFTTGIAGVSTGYYTVVVDGLYSIAARITIASLTAGKDLGVRIRVNGSPVQTITRTYQGTLDLAEVHIYSGSLSLAAGDTVDVQGVHNEGSSKNIDASECFFRMTQMSL